MASTFKTLLNNDVVSTRSMLHEAIPVTGTIVSGTYADNNIKNFTHGMFQQVYDYPYLSSSANHIFDITVGFSANSSYSASAPTTTLNPQQAKKINIYTEMAQILTGYDVSGSVRDFDRDGDLSSGNKMTECIFINLARLLSKDEVKKGSFTLSVLTGGNVQAPTAGGAGVGPLNIQDYDAINTYKVNSPAGEYGLLYTSSNCQAITDAKTSTSPVGHIYYQAGIVVLTASVFGKLTRSGSNPDVHVAGGDGTSNYFGPIDPLPAGFGNMNEALTGSAISASCDGLRNRFVNMSFNNTTELNSTIYFCRANNSEFNYSANPTYLSASKMVVKNNSTDTSVSYITTIGMYSADNELLATAKLSEPLKKTTDDEFTLRVRLDY
tara:strand:- start:576 stop:1718 length:1143 start_codon:yes stop_codon:yes gene_type:complete